MKKLLFVCSVASTTLLSGCLADHQDEINALRKQILEQERAIDSLQAQLEKEVKKSKALEERFGPWKEWIPIRIDQNSIAISAASNLIFGNEFSLTGTPSEHAHVLANHLALSTYKEIENPETDNTISLLKEGHYRNIYLPSDPYLLFLFPEPFPIRIHTVAQPAPKELEPLEILLIIKNKRPYLYFKEPDETYSGYALKDYSQYNFDLLFVAPLDYYANKLYFFNNN
ncbi:hypothetical protein ACFQWB_17160 [Paenibacillus thermoaerophilus]|uniref:Lipoprotein n=1 Tax=Paenibacillus thermoaerophilus TaxID=1215385 RepID=A0ABW2V8U6_9BACL|nr:hypothetical protein [Paenibacillus thermoaerophilus]TMV06303.1 hypothetical protein FE781_16860 [Paenibacillus thermoaerophilus]